MSEGVLFQDLAVMMVLAGAAAVVFSRFGWPKVFGYLLSGVVMSEHTWGGSLLADPASTQIVGQLGVVFLMFGMGLSFSPRAMKKIRTVAVPAALADALVMIWLGHTIGTRLFGWSSVQAFFLGVAICDSATTLLAKVLGEMGWSRRLFAKYVLGTSVCEDIVCVGAIAVATGFASGGAMSFAALMTSLGGLGIFLLSAVVVGFVLVPRLLASIGRQKDDEALLVAMLGCCFLVTYVAYRLGCSLALGAFLIGVIGGSSEVRDRLARLLDPLKAMYSAVFFISIGLLVDPAALARCLPEIALVSVVVIVGKFVNIFVACLAAGVGVKAAVQTGCGLAQIGEFAFLVALLYKGLAPESDDTFFTVAIGASLVTSLLNPPLLRLSDRLGDWVERVLPSTFAAHLDDYRAWIDKLRNAEESPSLRRLRAAAVRLGVYGVLMLSVSLVVSQLHHFDYSRFSPFFEAHDDLFFFLVANVLVLGILPLVLASARELAQGVADILLGESSARWVRPIRQTVLVFVSAAVIVLYLAEWSMLDIAVAPSAFGAPWAVLALFSLIGVVGWRFFVRAGRRATQRFQEALTAEERREALERTVTVTIPEGTVHRLTLGSTSPAVGTTVIALNVRAKTGASIVSVVRDGTIVRNIGPEWEFHVGDTLIALGDAHQIAALKDLMGVTA